MPGHGTLPKEHRSRSRDNAIRDAATSKLVADGVLRGPELPAGPWHERTLAWWETLRRSPLARTWIPEDWDTLIDTALVHTMFWEGDLKLAGELRLRMSQFGTSPEARLRLRIAVETEEAEAKATVTAVPRDRRRRLLKAVGDGA